MKKTREIKFRAWHKLAKHFCPMIMYSCAIFEDADKFQDYCKYHELSQFTGLKDRKGREIYEGDILGDIWEKCYIAWCDKCKGFQIFADYNDGCQRCSGDSMWDELVEDDGKLEIIGNIWENKELLNEECQV